MALPDDCQDVYALTGGNADCDNCDECPGPCRRGLAVEFNNPALEAVVPALEWIISGMEGHYADR